MTKNSRRLVIVVILTFSTCLAWLYASHPVQGQGQDDDLAKQVKSLSETVGSQQKDLESLKSTFEELKKSVDSNAQKSLELDRALNNKIQVHAERFKTIDEKFNTVDEKYKRLNESLRVAFARVNERLRALEQTPRR